MKRYTNSVVLRVDSSSTGNADEGAEVLVKFAGTTDLAPVFSDDAGTVSLIQPFKTNTLAQKNPGQFTFVAADGIYDIVINENLGEDKKTVLSGESIKNKDTLNLTKAEMIASKFLELNDVVVVTDRDDGRFDIVSGETGNGRNIIQLTGTSFQAKLRVVGSLNVKQYGAPVNGIDDDSVILQAANDNFNSVFCPPGQYSIQNNFFINQEGKQWLGAGGATVFNLSSGKTITIGNDATSSFTNHKINVGQFKILAGIYGLSVGGNGTGPKAVLGEIHNIEIKSATGAGLRLISPQGVDFNNINCDLNNVGLLADDLQANTASSFFRCRFFNSTSYGVHIKTCAGLSFYKCNIESNGDFGAFLNKQVGSDIEGIAFYDCHIEANTTNSIKSDDDAINNIQIIGCRISGAPVIHLDLNGDNIRIENNKFLGGPTATVSLNTPNASFTYVGNTPGSLIARPSSDLGIDENDGRFTARELFANVIESGISETVGGVNKVIDNEIIDGKSLSSWKSAFGDLGFQLTRFNCGVDADRVGWIMGLPTLNGRYWMDGTGSLRFKSSLPTSDTDGVTIGSQTFTGTHIYKMGEEIEVGDIVKLVDRKLYITTHEKDPMCIGVFAGLSDLVKSSFGELNVRQPIDEGIPEPIEKTTNKKERIKRTKKSLDDHKKINKAKFDALPESDLGAVIAIGDTRTSQNGVTSEGINCIGDVKVGHLLCPSSTPGKAMAQEDDLTHSYTIGKAIDIKDGVIYAYIYSG